MKFKIGEVVKNPEDGKNFVTITLSDDDLHIIKSSIEFYQGDKDDNQYKKKMEKLRENIHQVHRKLRPS